MLQNAPAETQSIIGCPDGTERSIGCQRTESVLPRLVKAARQNPSVGIHDAARKEAVATPRETAFKPVRTVLLSLVTAVTLVGRHQRMTLCVVIQLCRLEGQTVGSPITVVLLESLPLVLIGAQTKALQLYPYAAMV